MNTGKEVSTMKTCGLCHDTDYIERHSFHGNLAIENTRKKANGLRQMGFLKDWDPILYATFNPLASDTSEAGLTLPDLIQRHGRFFNGGKLTRLTPDGFSLNSEKGLRPHWQNKTYDAKSDGYITWDWKKSGVMENNCFVCHMENPDNSARRNALKNGKFGRANTATLFKTGIVREQDGRLKWQKKAFGKDGYLRAGLLNLSLPENHNCSQCHGLTHESSKPLSLPADLSKYFRTERTGNIFSYQRLNKSYLNLKNKEQLYLAWDVHAARMVKCVACHHSPNNPTYIPHLFTREYMRNIRSRDLTRVAGAYLYRPDHNLTSSRAGHKRVHCLNCHDVIQAHSHIPNLAGHQKMVSCLACHISKINAPARKMVDWTILNSRGKPGSEYRGISGSIDDPSSLIEGYLPYLLPVKDNKGDGFAFYTYNLITTWFWSEEGQDKPIDYHYLKNALFESEGQYHPAIMKNFDADKSGTLEEVELRVDSQSKTEAITNRLKAVGLKKPVIKGVVQPFAISHGVRKASMATLTCTTCHSENSRLKNDIDLSGYLPGGVEPRLEFPPSILLTAKLIKTPKGQLKLRAASPVWRYRSIGDSPYYIHLFGLLLVLSQLVGVSIHATVRFFSNKRRKLLGEEEELEPVEEVDWIYLYSIWNRIWHWVMALASCVLIITGLRILFPGIIPRPNFGLAVQLHYIFGFILLVNGFLGLFY
ncbi:hypothetical protein ACFL35_08990, partial [Candidatus Riflebacteria bacterium]